MLLTGPNDWNKPIYFCLSSGFTISMCETDDCRWGKAIWDCCGVFAWVCWNGELTLLAEPGPLNSGKGAIDKD